MNSLNDGREVQRGVISTLAKKIKVIDMDDTREGIAIVSEIGNEVKKAQLAKEMMEKNKAEQTKKTTEINPYKLGEEAKKYVENNEMDRE